MSKIPKYLQIDSFSKNDLSDMFNAICENVIKVAPLKVKQEVLKLGGTKRELDAFKPTIMSLLTVIAAYDIPFEFRVLYAEDGDVIDPPEDDMELTKKLMKKQSEEIEAIKKDEYIGGKLVQEVEVVNSSVVKPDDLPEFN